jgi:hypothetical protein
MDRFSGEELRTPTRLSLLLSKALSWNFNIEGLGQIELAPGILQ